jgi:hypothetical protein
MSAGNGIHEDTLAAKAARAAEHAAQLADGMRERLEERADQLEAKIEHVDLALAAHEKGSRDRKHALTDGIAAVGATAEATAAQVVVLGVRVAELIEAVGPEHDPRKSIHDLDADAIAALANHGIRPALGAILAAHAMDRRAAERAAEEQALAVAKVARTQKRSAGLLAAFVLILHMLRESGAFPALVRYLSGG